VGRDRRDEGNFRPHPGFAAFVMLRSNIHSLLFYGTPFDILFQLFIPQFFDYYRRNKINDLSPPIDRFFYFQRLDVVYLSCSGFEQSRMITQIWIDLISGPTICIIVKRQRFAASAFRAC
jgi:hypothetical protein